MSNATALSEISGIPKTEMLRIFEEVQLNLAKLNCCDGHRFEAAAPKTSTGRKYRCVNCQGEIDHHAHRWFTIGQNMPAEEH